MGIELSTSPFRTHNTTNKIVITLRNMGGGHFTCTWYTSPLQRIQMV